MNKNRNIREFLYIDIHRLYSFYSQIFEGLTEKIIEERVDQSTTCDAQGSFFRQASSSSQGVEASKYIESSILYDHMYSKLEEKLNIKDISTLSDFDKDKSLENNSIIKITGYLEIEDYQNLDSLLEKFNKIGESIAHSMISSSAEIMARKKELTERLVEASSKNKKEIQEQINNLSNPKFIAKDLKLWQDPILLENYKIYSKNICF